MPNSALNYRLILVFASVLLVAACANRGNEQSAMASAESTKIDQNKAQADKALGTAQQALQMAQKAEADAQAAQQKANMMYQRNLRK